ILRLLLAAALGATIGYQRERAAKPAGLRTHILICVGAALFTVASLYGFGAVADPARVAAGIVAGIGFIGAGAIMRRDEGLIAGLTTAATIWAVAAIGLAVGAGLYLVSAVTTVLILIVLYLPHPIR
ncbi:MgtC/SapB family protein, partial [Patescibacteria group bacterium]|nr:MgtC/SapB family protein [Patescibacteria group bacterium]